MAENIAHDLLLDLIGNQLGTHDVACPLCGPGRRSPKNRRRAVLRIWHEVPGFITYSCARCGTQGFARAYGSGRLVCIRRREPEPLNTPSSPRSGTLRREKAQWLWGLRQPLAGTPAEIYLRRARCHEGPLPGTVEFLPAIAQHPAALIAAFGLAGEMEPGVISISTSEVAGVHLTRVASHGFGKAGTETDKIMVGAPLGSPIVLAAPNDLGGLAITEGIEDALSVHEATGLGAWAAGAASFLPALAAAVPDWIECITVLVDDDEAGRRNADELTNQLEHRGFAVRLVTPTEPRGPLP
jgi:hypothetical protein